MENRIIKIDKGTDLNLLIKGIKDQHEEERRNNKYGIRPSNYMVLKPIIDDPKFKSILDLINEVDFEDDAEEENHSNRRSKKSLLNDENLVRIIENLQEVAHSSGSGLVTTKGSLYIYHDSWWQTIPEDTLKIFIRMVAIQSGIRANEAKIHKNDDRYVSQFRSTTTIEPAENLRDHFLINMQNGVLCIKDGETGFHTPKREDFLTHKLPFKYDPDAKAPLFQKFIDRVLPDKECQDIIFEFIGSVFTNLKLEKVLMLVGDGANGKSVLSDIITALFDSDNVTEYSLQSLCDNKDTCRAGIEHKLLNWSTETGSGKFDVEAFKKLASGEPIEARSLYHDKYIIKQYARLAFCSNSMPSSEFTHAFFRRLLIIPFQVTISDDEKDIKLSEKIILTELPGVFNLVMDGIKRLVENKAFTHSSIVENIISKYRTESNNVAVFVKELNLKPSTDKKIRTNDLLTEYQLFCKTNGYHPSSRSKFHDRLKQLGFQLKEGANHYMYIWCERSLSDLDQTIMNEILN